MPPIACCSVFHVDRERPWFLSAYVLCIRGASQGKSPTDVTGNIALHGPQGHGDNLFFDGNWNVTAVSEHSGKGYVGDAGE